MTTQNNATLSADDSLNTQASIASNSSIDTQLPVDASSNANTNIGKSKTETEQDSAPMTLKERFRKFVPVIVDVETAGFNAQTDALLEIACIPILLDEHGVFYPGEHLMPISNLLKVPI